MFYSYLSNLTNIGRNHRQNDRRKGTDRRKCVDGRGADRRKTQRRAFFRVNYPAKNQLKVLNMDVEVVDICQKSLRFFGFDQWDKLSKVIGNNGILELFVLFHDNTVEKVKGRLTKSYSDIHSRKQYYVLMFIKDINFKKISAEQSYILKHFPDFGRQLFDKSCQAG